MLTLKKLSDTYNEDHPTHANLLNHADVTNKELNVTKRKILQPYLEEQKLNGRIIIYKEKFVGFVLINNVEMSDKGFKADIQALDPLMYPSEHYHDIEGKRWKIGGPWNMLMCNDTSIGCFYVGWNIWPEASYTKYIEEIYLNKGKQAAYVEVVNSLRT